MTFHDSAFEKAYLAIIKEEAELEVPVCPTCGAEMTDLNGDGNFVCLDCDPEDPETTVDECGDGECDGENCDECDDGECDGENCDEAAEEPEAPVDTDAEAPEEPEEDADAEEPAEGKFISFFTTDQALIDALQNGFAKITVTFDDEKEDPAEFTADVFENLSVEDLKDDEESDEADVDVDAAAEDEETPAEDEADKKADK